MRGEEREVKQNKGVMIDVSKEKFISRGRAKKIVKKEDKRTLYQDSEDRGATIIRRKVKGKISFRI